MKLPRVVKIDGLTYPVERLPQAEEYEGLDGLCYTEGDGPLILINMRRGERARALTLLHEILHGVLAPLHLGYSHEEGIVSRLEEGLGATIEKNPTFFRDLITLLRRTRSPRRKKIGRNV